MPKQKTREIKFRAWDKDLELYVNEVIFTNDKVYYGYRDFEDDIGDTSLELMQYTGLKDKNGVEIYEGDVVRTEAHYEGDSYPKWVDAENIEIIFEDGAFNIDSAYIKNNGIEVIGNIYENKELLDE